MVSIFPLFFLLSAAGVKCYVCSGSEKTCSKSNLESSSDKLVECDTDMCMRIWQKAKSVVTVSNLCSTQSLCDSNKSTCDILNDADSFDCAVGCCSTDACNTGLPVSINVFMLTVSSVLGMALMM